MPRRTRSIVLFGLNAVDELDRAAFAVLLPDIRDHFDLSNAGALRLVSLTTIAVLLIEVPLSFYCDRGNRVRIATIGAAVWALFSFGTGAAVVVGSLGMLDRDAHRRRDRARGRHADALVPAVRLLRAGGPGEGVLRAPAGELGRADPRSAARRRHRGVRSGWRGRSSSSPSRPSCSSLMSLRLHEPVRGYHERKAAGLDEEAALVADAARGRVVDDEGALPGAHHPADLVRGAVPRRSRSSGWPQLLSLVYEEVFDLDSAGRGLIAAGVEPLQVIGVFVAMPRIAKIAMTRPRLPPAVRRDRRGGRRVRARRARLLARTSGWPSLMHFILSASIGTLAPAFFALISIVAPPRVRAASFSTISVFAIPGIAVFLPADRAGVRPPRHPGEHGGARPDRGGGRLHPAVGGSRS